VLDTTPRIVSAKTEYMQAINFQNMRFSSLFSFGRKPAKASLAFHSLQTPGATGDHSLLNDSADQKPAVAVSSLQSAVEAKIDVSITTWFLPKQLSWINDSQSDEALGKIAALLQVRPRRLNFRL